MASTGGSPTLVTVVVTLTEQAQLNASDPAGRRIELDADAVLHVGALPGSEHAVLAGEVAAKMPLAWLLQTKPSDHGF
jgi:hypothetical protein